MYYYKEIDSNSLGEMKALIALVGLLFALIGIHKLLVGQYIRFVLYVLFCWTLIPLLLSAIECVYIIFISEDTFRKKYHTCTLNCMRKN